MGTGLVFFVALASNSLARPWRLIRELSSASDTQLQLIVEEYVTGTWLYRPPRSTLVPITTTTRHAHNLSLSSGNRRGLSAASACGTRHCYDITTEGSGVWRGGHGRVRHLPGWFAPTSGSWIGWDSLSQVTRVIRALLPLDDLEEDVPCTILSLQMAGGGTSHLRLNSQAVGLPTLSHSTLTAVDPEAGLGLFVPGINGLELAFAHSPRLPLHHTAAYVVGAVEMLCPLSKANTVAVAPFLGPLHGGTLVTFKMATSVGPGVTCRFGTYAELPGTLQSDGSSLRCVSPASSVEQWVHVEVRTRSHSQSRASILGSFYYHSPVRLSSVAPYSGPVTGGTELELRGVGFVRGGQLTRCASAKVRDERRLGGENRQRKATGAAWGESMASSRLFCSTHAWTRYGGGKRVFVSMNGQQFSASGVAFAYLAVAEVSSVWPPRGAVEGGTPVTVLGSGFGPPHPPSSSGVWWSSAQTPSSRLASAGRAWCRFNGADAAAAVYVSDATVV